MSIQNCLDMVQSIAKQIFRNRYTAKIDSNYNIECSYIRKKWNFNNSNHLVIQFYIKKPLKSYLVEEWNIVCEFQQIADPLHQFLQECNQISQLSPLHKEKTHNVEHLLTINEKKRADWIDPQAICSKQIQLSNKITVNLAYMENTNAIEDFERDSQNEFQEFRRERFLSDDMQKEQYSHIRKTSFHDIDSRRNFEKNQAMLQKLTHNPKMASDSVSSNSSKNKQGNQILSIVNKKDDVEILSSFEDAQKIIDEDEDGDFEIQMIIDEQPVNGKTIIIKQISQQDQILEQLSTIKSKNYKKSTQIIEIIDFINQIH